MSAPDTDLEKQKRRHRPSLSGIAFVAVFGVTMIVILSFVVFARGDEPVTPDTRIDGRTGETVEVE